MRIWEFVVTGGPCAGKTTGLSVLEQMLTNKGYKVIVVPETATETITSGITPWEIDNIHFQGIIFDRSLNKEKTTRRAAVYMNRDVVIIYDRGLLDNKAYMTREAFEQILKERGLTETEVRDQYDAVFHLVTAADGAEQFYTLENNVARSESPEQARALDVATRNAWIGHPHLRIIDNSTEFKEKIGRLLTEVYSVMGLPTPIEIERKYLIKKPNIELLESLGSVKLNILQTYLHRNDPLVERRIRQRGDGRGFSYYYTEKKDISGLSRIETERRIDEKEYLSLLMEGEKCLRKDRYCFVHDSQYFELDIYPGWEDIAILEIEITEESQIPNIPKWIDVIKEVTGNPNYLNANLAK